MPNQILLGGTRLDSTFYNTVITPQSLFYVTYVGDNPGENYGGFLSVDYVKQNVVKFKSTRELDYNWIIVLVFTPESPDAPEPVISGSGERVDAIFPQRATLVDGTATVQFDHPPSAGGVGGYITISGTPGILRMRNRQYLSIDFSSSSGTDNSTIGCFLCDNWYKPTPPTPAQQNLMAGQAVLQNGQAIVKCPEVKADSIILNSRHTLRGTPGYIQVCSIEPGVGFCLESLSREDNSSVDWFFMKDA